MQGRALSGRAIAPTCGRGCAPPHSRCLVGRAALGEIEAEAIRFAITHCGGRMSEVARRLRIGRSTLYPKLDSLGRDAAISDPKTTAWQSGYTRREKDCSAGCKPVTARQN